MKQTKNPELLRPTKWTSTPNQGKKYCGWKVEGLKHFTDLYYMVEKDRNDNKKKAKVDQAEYKYLKKKQEQENGNGNETNSNPNNTEAERRNLNVAFDPWDN